MYVLAVDSIANAQVALDAGRPTEARVLLESRIKSSPGDARAMALLARTYHQLKLPQQAAAAAARAASLGPAVPAVQHTLALYYAQSGQRKLAATWEGRYAASSEADPAAPLRAALLFAEVQQWPEAITFGQAAQKVSDRPDLHRMLARAYEATGKPGEAIAEHKALLAQLPFDEPAHAEFGQALLRLGRFSEASAFLEQARTQFDKSPQIELALGVAFYAQRRFSEAGASFFRVIDLAPAVPQPYIFLARMLDQLPDKVPELRRRAEAWHRAEPKNAFAPFVLARALQAAGEPDDQIKPLLLEAIRRNPTAWEFPFELGQLYERQRDYPTAARTYLEAIRANPKVPEPHYRLARVYDRLQQPLKAERERALHKQLSAQPRAAMQ